ncbi:MAG: transketolase [Candidatus Kappaea frigidicola]|nr:transketolase [Candidatus Kappaea frigidicola]
MKKRPDINELKEKAIKIRSTILKMLQIAGSGHTGGSLSEVEIILTLYKYEMSHNSKKPEWEQRDRFILSKGHGCPTLYAVLADCGYFSEDLLWTLRKMGSKLQGHPQRNVPLGLEASTGSLGQGLSIALGLALAAKMDKKDFRTYCLMGDGELQEGQIWEAAMMASFNKLDNLCGIVDNNKIQIDGFLKDVMNVEPLAEKWESFGWEVIRVDGHDVVGLMDAFDKVREIKGKPSVILADTIKGKGISFMENKASWHGVAPKEDEVEKALVELKKQK